MIYKNLGNTDTKIAAIGMGTWGYGGHHKQEFTVDEGMYYDLLQRGVELGMTLIDTSENYGGGLTEKIVGRAIRDIRDKVFIATKATPNHLDCDRLRRSVDKSLKRLRIDAIDLYQIHWPNPDIDIRETIETLKCLQLQGKIKHIGISNYYDINDLKILEGCHYVSHQLEYNLIDRYIEEKIIPFYKYNNYKKTIMAYEPFKNGNVEFDTDKYLLLKKLSDKYDKTVHQIILNWIISKDDVIVVPKTVNLNHIEENAAAADFTLEPFDIIKINNTFITNYVFIELDQIRCEKEINDNFVPNSASLGKFLDDGGEIKPIKVYMHDDGYYRISEGACRYAAYLKSKRSKDRIQVILYKKGE